MARNDNLRGAAVAVASLGAFACNDAIVKHVMLTLPEVQAVFLRGLLAVPLVSALSAYRRELFTPAASRDRRLIAVRCVMDAANSFSFLAAIHRGPMADVAVVLAVQPLLVMLGARVLGERIEPVQWALAFVGLLGVVVVSRPGGHGADSGAGARGSSILFAAACAVLGSIRDLLARRLGRRVPSTQVAALSAAAVTVSAGVASLPQIASASGLQPTPRELVLLCAASLFVAAALVGSVLQIRLGATGFVQPFPLLLHPVGHAVRRGPLRRLARPVDTAWRVHRRGLRRRVALARAAETGRRGSGGGAARHARVKPAARRGRRRGL